jgi:hypothetical protein
MMKLFCTGDIAIFEDVMPEWLPPPGFFPSEQEKILFNWELPIGSAINPVPRSRGPRLISHRNSINVIRNWAPGFAALATNHILDAGKEGLALTISSLTQAGFQTVGAGETEDEIKRPVIWETDEGRLAIVNWVFPETHPEWEVLPGPNCWPGLQAAIKVIEELKEKVDWVLVFSHWSDELFPYPRPEDRIIANELAKAGVDMVIGHHPHVIRGMEWFGACPVFYSIGNHFFSDYPNPDGGWVVKQAPRNRESLGILLTFHKSSLPEVRIKSFWNARKKTRPDLMLRGYRRLNTVSRPLQQYSGDQYSSWYTLQRRRFDRWRYRVHFRLWSLGLSGFAKHLLRFPNRPKSF